VLLRISGVEYFVEPIGVGISHVIGHSVLIQSVRIGRSSPPAVDAFLREDAFGIHIVASLVHQSHITGIVAYEREVIVGHLHDSRIRIGDLRFTFSAFGGDEDHSVSGTRTVNSC